MRKTLRNLVVAMAISSLPALALADDAVPGKGAGKGVQAGMAGSGAAFVDADGDGVCDRYAGDGAGKGNRYRHGKGGKGNGAGKGQGLGKGQGMGKGLGRGFVDANGDGVCDRAAARGGK
ncbi:MAG: hypothetical protein FJ087_13075 [Deltaproteobacteria bacterium]|nr:hypothetical protein [Deltaproteobacteria bacterium]